MPKSKLRLPLNDAHYNALGQVTARATGLEVIIDLVIWRLLRVMPNVGRAITTRRNAADKIKLLRTLADLLVTEEDEPGRMNKLFNEVHAALGERNDLIHGIWAEAGEAVAAYKYTADGKLRVKVRHWTPGEMLAVATRLETASGDLLDFYRILQMDEEEGQGGHRLLPE
jgi:hypothetical protein